ncbi:hypothetical protein X962_5884 [Burkholderia pseudomallei MSHR7343]|nr:hypothetical protein X948_5676 [Burkholderia pseudomallei MSHR5608]KGS19437.1 hypothetical protein X962_5884 [Burkholderia pseudomallei MSHR7343]
MRTWAASASRYASTVRLSAAKPTCLSNAVSFMYSARLNSIWMLCRRRAGAASALSRSPP